MKKGVVLGFVFLVMFFAAFAGGLLVLVPQAFVQVASPVIGRASLNQIMTPCGGGDPGGGGRPGSIRL